MANIISLLVPDVRFNSNNLAFPASAASLPRPGVPVGDVEFGVFETSGVQAYDEIHTITPTNAGLPEADAQVAVDAKGWTPANALTDTLSVPYASNLSHCALNLNDGTGIIITVGGSAATATVRILTPVDGVLTEIASLAGVVTQTSNVDACQLESGLVLFYYRSGSYLHSLSWSPGDASLEYYGADVGTDEWSSFSVATLNGVVVFFASQKQFTSTDQGVTFKEIEDWATIPRVASGSSILAYRDHIILVWQDHSLGVNQLWLAVADSADAPLSSAPVVEITSGVAVDDASGPWLLPHENDAFLDIYYGLQGRRDRVQVVRGVSNDPTTWVQSGGLEEYIDFAINFDHVDYYISDAFGFADKGSLYLYTEVFAAGIVGNPIVLKMGTWTQAPTNRHHLEFVTVTAAASQNELDSVAWGYSGSAGVSTIEDASSAFAVGSAYVPEALTPWALVGTSPTPANDLWTWDFTAGAATGYETTSPATVLANHAMYLVLRGRCLSGGDLTADAVAVHVAGPLSATTGFDLSLRLTPTQAVVWDNAAGAATSTETVLGSYWCITANAGGISFFNGPTPDSLTLLWTVAVGAFAVALIEWGQITASTSASEWSLFNWVFFRFASSLTTAGTALVGRRLSANAVGVDTKGLMLALKGGPLTLADDVAISPRFEKGPDNLDLIKNASPSITAEGDGTGELLYIPSGGDSTIISDGHYGVLLMNTNIKTAIWRRLQGASFWNGVGSINTATLVGVGYARRGDVVTPDSAAGVDGNRWYERDELAGCVVNIGTAGPWETTVKGNTEGVWKTGPGDHANMSIFLDSIPGGAPSGGVMSVYQKDFLLILQDGVTAPKYKLDTMTHGGDALRIGGMMVGPMVYLSPSHARGRIVDTDANTSTVESRGGQRWSSIEGPVGRTVRVAWTDAMDLTTLHDGDVDPGVITVDSVVVGGLCTAKTVLEGLQYQLDGDAVPLAYVPNTPTVSASGSAPVKGRRELVFGRLTTGITTTAVGSTPQDPTVTDVVRVSQIEIREER